MVNFNAFEEKMAVETVDVYQGLLSSARRSGYDAPSLEDLLFTSLYEVKEKGFDVVKAASMEASAILAGVDLSNAALAKAQSYLDVAREFAYEAEQESTETTTVVEAIKPATIDM